MTTTTKTTTNQHRKSFRGPKMSSPLLWTRLPLSAILLLIFASCRPNLGQQLIQVTSSPFGRQSSFVDGPQTSQLPLEQQFSAALAAVASQQQQQQQQQPIQLNSISPSANIIASKVASDSASSGDSQQISGSVSSSGRLRTPRSIGEMFKKLFNGSKRSKQSQSNRNEWDQQSFQQQQQHYHQQQQQQLHQQQNQAMAQLAAAAANQHAVYASPFATYSPQSASGLYSQFATPYSGASLFAWPTTTGLTGAIRGTPTLLSAQPAPATVALTAAGSAGPLYAAASQSYNSFAPPPPGAVQQNGQSMAAAASGPTAAASNPHASALPAPPTMAHGAPSSPSSIDFHQVLDALVRTSGFTPAGDQEAAQGGYSAKSDGTPVFSFKKLVSLPFYLSTEEKPLDGLANAAMSAGAPSAGYSFHSMPIMRRHVRRMSTPSTSSNQQQQQQQLAQSLGSYMDSQLQRSSSERAQQQHYTNYFNALNNQLASNQLAQYFQQQQQQSPTSGLSQAASNTYESYAAPDSVSALANYQAALAAYNSPSVGQQSYKQSSRSSQSALSGANMAMAASMNVPMAVQPPQGLSMNQQQQSMRQQQQYEQQQQDIQQLLNSMQQPDNSAYNSLLAASQVSQDGHRFGAQPQYYYSNGNNINQQVSSGATGNDGQQSLMSSSQLDYMIGQSGSQQQQQLQQSNQLIDNQATQQQQQPLAIVGQQDSQAQSSPLSQSSNSASQLQQQQQPITSQSSMGTQQQSNGQQPQQQQSGNVNNLREVSPNNQQQLQHTFNTNPNASVNPNQANGSSLSPSSSSSNGGHNQHQVLVASMTNFSPISTPNHQQQSQVQQQQQHHHQQQQLDGQQQQQQK